MNLTTSYARNKKSQEKKEFLSNLEAHSITAKAHKSLKNRLTQLCRKCENVTGMLRVSGEKNNHVSRKLAAAPILCCIYSAQWERGG